MVEEVQRGARQATRTLNRGTRLVALAALLWGLVAPVAQEAYTAGWRPETLALYTHLAALPASLAVIAAYPHVAREALVYGMLLGAMRVAYLESVELNTGPVAAAALYTAPLIVAVFERAGLRLYILASLAVAGVWLALGAPLEPTPGLLVALASSASYAALIIYTGRIRGDPLRVAIGAQGAGLAPVALLCIASGCRGGTGPLYHPILLAIGPGFLAYTLYIRGVRLVGATRASIVSTLEPVTAATVSWLLGARISPLQGVGVGVTIASIILASLG